MIPDLAIIIGLYVITRYCTFIHREPVYIKVMSGVFILITLIIMVVMQSKGLPSR